MASAATLRRASPVRVAKENAPPPPKAKKPTTGTPASARKRAERTGASKSQSGGGSRAGGKAQNGDPPRRSDGSSGGGGRTAAHPIASATRYVGEKLKGEGGHVAKESVKAAMPGTPSGVAGGLAKTAAKKAGKFMLQRALAAGRHAVQSAADRAAVAGREVMEASVNHRLPIQASIDVGVPIAVAWEEWTKLHSLPEGVDVVSDIERDGQTLTGTTSGPGGGDWEAEILDERPNESFAWRSVHGSDCAGLVTFHELSERLTRVELDLDVVPVGPAQTASFALHLAHRRARSELRRFKARVEFINPDVYEQEAGSDE